MKILFLSDNFFPETNAAASRVYERAKLWAEEGHQVTILTSCPNFPEGRPHRGYKNHWRFVEEIDGLRVVRVKTFMAPNQGVTKRMLDFISFMLSSFFWGLWEARPDIVVASSPQFFAAPSGYALSFFKRCPFVLEIADLWPESVRAVGVVENHMGRYFLDFMEKVELFLYRNATSVVCLTPSIRENIVKRGIEPEKVVTVINGVNLDFFNPIPKKDPKLLESLDLQGKFVVGYIGTFGMAHDLANCLAAAKILQEQGHQQFHFLIVGAGAEKKKLEHLIFQDDLTNVTMVSRQPKSEIQRYWSLCDLALVHLKNSSTFRTVIPSKIFEAMALGLPILYCGPESDGSSIVVREGVGIQIESGAPAKLAQQILQLASDPKGLDSMREQTGVSAHRYSRKQQAESFLHVLDESCSANAKKLGAVSSRSSR